MLEIEAICKRLQLKDTVVDAPVKMKRGRPRKNVEADKRVGRSRSLLDKSCVKDSIKKSLVKRKSISMDAKRSTIAEQAKQAGLERE